MFVWTSRWGENLDNLTKYWHCRWGIVLKDVERTNTRTEGREQLTLAFRSDCSMFGSKAFATPTFTRAVYTWHLQTSPWPSATVVHGGGGRSQLFKRNISILHPLQRTMKRSYIDENAVSQRMWGRIWTSNECHTKRMASIRIIIGAMEFQRYVMERRLR